MKILKGVKRLGRNPSVGRAERLRRCKPVIALACVAFALIMILGSTLAWFTMNDSVANPLEGSPEKYFSVQVVDIFDKDRPWDYKKVGVVNTGEKPAFVRLLVIPTFVISADPNVPGSTPIILPVQFDNEALLKVDFNTADWRLGEDGYYYYLHVLDVGENTNTSVPNKNLFNSVVANGVLSDSTSLYYQAELCIEVKCEAVYIAKWDYRVAWWNDSNTTSTSAFPAAKPKLKSIDEALAPLTK